MDWLQTHKENMDQWMYGFITGIRPACNKSSLYVKESNKEWLIPHAYTPVHIPIGGKIRALVRGKEHIWKRIKKIYGSHVTYLDGQLFVNFDVWQGSDCEGGRNWLGNSKIS